MFFLLSGILETKVTDMGQLQGYEYLRVNENDRIFWKELYIINSRDVRFEIIKDKKKNGRIFLIGNTEIVLGSPEMTEHILGKNALKLIQ